MSEFVPFRPLEGYRVGLDALSTVLTAYSAEQRLGLRVAPRLSFDLAFEVNGTQLHAARRLARRIAAAGNACRLPDWRAGVRLDVTAAQTSLDLGAAAPYFVAGGELVIWQSAMSYAIADVQSVVGSIVTITATGLDMSQAIVAPVVESIVTGAIELSLVGVDFARVSLTAAAINAPELPAAAPPTLSGVEILDWPRFNFGEVRESIIRPSVFVDNGTGPIAVEPERLTVEGAMTLDLFGEGVADLVEVEGFLQRRVGRVEPFLMPLETLDYIPLAGSPSGKLRLPADANISDLANTVIAIDLANGSRHFAKVTAVTVPGSYADLTLSPARPASAPISACEVALCRLDTDEIDFTFATGGAFTVGATVKRIDNEL